MTVQSLVKMFETMAVSARVDTSKQVLKSSLPERSNVLRPATYYDGLIQTEESVVTKSVRQDKSVTIKKELQQPKMMVLQMEEKELKEQKYIRQVPHTRCSQAPVTKLLMH
ncbi:unnamed protein product [Peronospora belbahrii]|uniref:Uncharacterized protein n=1 Tax=Peronospora belbahrii TaxID=622444 RepID=A0AAU9LDU2_9STRA|nr:unnamed protein product [Peronospora belbahrii]